MSNENEKKSAEQEEKPWREMSERDIYKIKKEKCRHCVYATRNGKGNEDCIKSILCDYIGKEGHSRGCRPDKCDKFKRKTKTRKGKKRE